LKDGEGGKPPGNMRRALVFQAVVAMVAVPLPLCLGWWGIEVRSRRLDVERRVRGGGGEVVDGGAESATGGGHEA